MTSLDVTCARSLRHTTVSLTKQIVQIFGETKISKTLVILKISLKFLPQNFERKQKRNSNIANFIFPLWTLHRNQKLMDKNGDGIMGNSSHVKRILTEYVYIDIFRVKIVKISAEEENGTARVCRVA